MGAAAVLGAALVPLAPPAEADDACGAPADHAAWHRAATFRRALSAVVRPEPAAAEAETEPDTLIVIDLKERTLTLFVDGGAVKRYPVGVGKDSTPTPPGEWRVVHKDRGWGGGFGTRWLGLDVPWGIYGIHGTNRPGSIGGYVSGGCIRMQNRHVEDLWPRVPRGTLVRIVGPLAPLPATGRIRPGVSSKTVVTLQLALRAAGHDPGRADGRYGPSTVAAVRKLEAWYGLVRDGEVGPDELALLGP